MKVKILFFSYGSDYFITTADQYLQGDDKVYVVLELPDGSRHSVNLYKYTDLDKNYLDGFIRDLNKRFKGKELDIPEDHYPTINCTIGHFKKGVPGNAKTMVRKNYRKFNNLIRKQLTNDTKISPL